MRRLLVRAERVVELGVDGRWQVVVVGGEDTAGAEDARCLRERRLGLHPVERLRAGDDVRRATRKAGVVRVALAVLDAGSVLGRRQHRRVGLDADRSPRQAGPGSRREASPAAEVDDQRGPRGAGVAAEQLEQRARRPGTEAVVPARKPLAVVAGGLDQRLGEAAHAGEATATDIPASTSLRLGPLVKAHRSSPRGDRNAGNAHGCVTGPGRKCHNRAGISRGAGSPQRPAPRTRQDASAAAGSAGAASSASSSASADTISGSNCVPAQRSSSAIASSTRHAAPVDALGGHRVERVGDEDDPRARAGSRSPGRPSG